MAAQVITLTDNQRGATKVRTVRVDWTSATGGTVLYTILKPDGLANEIFSGYLMKVVTVPGTGGVQPGSYAITVKDANGVDLLNGNGSARSITATENAADTVNGIPVPSPLANTTLTIGITGANDAKSGTVYLHIAQS
jgi:hypothetical protein